MSIEHIFEELETQFDSELNSRKGIPVSVEKLATTVGGNRITLDRPVLGETYVCGVIGGKAIWRFQPHKTMALLRLNPSDELVPPAKSAPDLLRECLSGRFIRYNLTNDGSQIRKARVLGVCDGLILFEPANAPTGVAIERLAWLEVHASDN